MDNQISLDDAFKEVYTVLTFSDSSITSKIPDDVYRSIVEHAANSNLEPVIDSNKELLDQAISEEGKDLLAIIYYSFVCDAEEKKDLFRIWSGM